MNIRSNLKELMTNKITTVPVGTSIHEARVIMSDKRIRHLPVVDENNEIVCVLQQKDLDRFFDTWKIPVDRISNTSPSAVSQDTPIYTAIFKMLENKLTYLLVLDEANEAVGIVTTDDLLFLLAQLLKKEIDKKVRLTSLIDVQSIGQIASKLSDVGI